MRPTAEQDRDTKHKKVVIALVELNVLIEKVREEQQDFCREVRQRDTDLREFIAAQFVLLRKSL
jgi:hypothetical protein